MASAVLGEGLGENVVLMGRLVRFSHTIFAMPFALSMFVVAQSMTTFRVIQLFWILIALVSARSMAMAYNRYLDREVDAQNPRTLNRELPQGRIALTKVRSFILFSGAIFLFSAWKLGSLCFLLSPIVLLVLLGYSWTKRFTSLSHIVLGCALALAPGGVWIAVVGSLGWLPVWLMAAVLFWVAGFDIIYSCQDDVFDRAKGLYSIPARFGRKAAFFIAVSFHIASVLLLVGFGSFAGLGSIYYVGVLVFALVLFGQYSKVSLTNLERVEQSFFTHNGMASILFFFGVVLDKLLMI